ncbi:AAA family ATPase [Zhihengliuella sp.]|uniref:AAA family ATPase n=1 Tax=Zhihengliuella sp. TaxID=1954483 RepID=UPI00281186AE|nr:AAA family ATPase [Zhihengliuella sp.]
MLLLSPATRLSPRVGLPLRRKLTVAVVGIDGAGKTTAASHLAADAADAGWPAQFIKNPSGRRWLSRLQARLGITVPARLLDGLETAVRTGTVLRSTASAERFAGLTVMDRHLACQSVLREVRGLPAGRWLPALHRVLARRAGTGRRFGGPDVVVLLDVDPVTALERITARGEDSERLEHLRAAREAYLRRAEAEGWTVIDAIREAPEVLRDLRRAVL